MNDPENKNYEPHPNEAWSYPGAEMPWETLWTEERNGETYHFARDGNGDLYYQTERGIGFAKEMEEARKRKIEKRQKK